jgi:anti-anti-sigma factor
MEEFSIKSGLNGKVAVVTIAGRVDSATAPTMDAELEKTVSGNKKVVLDLKDVEYMSSAGVRAIVKALRQAHKNRGGLKLARPSDPIVEILHTIGMMEIVQVYPSVEEAIASF